MNDRKMRRFWRNAILAQETYGSELEEYMAELALRIDEETVENPGVFRGRRAIDLPEKFISDPGQIKQTMEYLTYNEQTCFFTGHRDEGLPTDPHERLVLMQRLGKAILHAILKGYRIFINGGCNGIDIIAAEMVEYLKPHISETGLVLVTMVPFKRQPVKWTQEWQTRYRALINEHSDVVCYLNSAYHSGCYAARNRMMVEYGDLCIAVEGEHGGGTRQTINMAIKKGNKKILIIPCNSSMHALYMDR